MSNPSSIEVTDREFRKTFVLKENNRGKNKRNAHKNITKMNWGMLTPSRKQKDSDSVSSKQSISVSSVQQSIESMTINSGTTIQASNLHNGTNESNLLTLASKQSASETSKHTKPPTPWKSLKRLVSKGRHNKQNIEPILTQSSSDMTDSGTQTQRRRAKSQDGAKLPRKLFDGESHDSVSATDSQYVADQAIRGRLDGMDTLSLGPASTTSLPVESVSKADDNASNEDGDAAFSFDPLHFSFTGPERLISPATIVDEMIWNSAGIGQAEIVFEGYYPGCNDRWGVRISNQDDQLAKASSETERDPWFSLPIINDLFNLDKNANDDSTATTTPDNDGSTNLPVSKLWNSLWGVDDQPPPIPSHMQIAPAEEATTIDDLTEEYEGNQEFVNMCNVPVDLDEDAFMINCPEHVSSIHNVVMLPLQARRLDSAVAIFEKLLRGLEGSQTYLHLVASTSHNIGMIQLCQKKYREALKSFQTAVKVRKECLPKDHPDIAVSLQREGMAHFAIGSMNEAVKSFKAALAICSFADSRRAKLLNSIGVVRYHLKEFSRALDAFTSALEIQLPLLGGPVRRESIIYSTSTMLSNIGKVHLSNGKYAEAYSVFEEACLMLTSTFRKDNEVVLQSMGNMARAQVMNENYSDALNIFTSLYKVQKGKFGIDHKDCFETLAMMGMSHCMEMEYEEAENCMNAVVAWQIKQVGMDTSHPLVKVAKITSKRLVQINRRLEGKESIWI